MVIRIKKYDLEFVFISIYITSKLLWDQIPYIFELLFWIIVLWSAANSIYCLLNKGKIPIILIFMAVLSLYVVVDGLLQDEKGVFVRSIYEYIVYMMVMLYFIQIRKNIDLIKCLKIIIVWGVAIAILTWYEYLTRHYLLRDLSSFSNIMYAGNNGFRASVFSRSYLCHGVVLGIFSIMALYLWNILGKKKYLYIGMFEYLTILATSSRGPLVSFFCAIVFFYFIDVFFITKKKSKKYKFVLLGVAAAILLMIILNIHVDATKSSVSYFVFRIQNVFNWTGDAGNVGRILKWKNAIEDWFLISPFWGIGPSKTGSWGAASLGVTESGILKRLCELGIIGAILFYLFIFYIVKNFTKVENVTYKREMLLWMSIFVGIFVNDITVQTTEEIMVSFWFWCALGGIYYLKRKDYQERIT